MNCPVHVLRTLERHFYSRLVLKSQAEDNCNAESSRTNQAIKSKTKEQIQPLFSCLKEPRLAHRVGSTGQGGLGAYTSPLMVRYFTLS